MALSSPTYTDRSFYAMTDLGLNSLVYLRSEPIEQDWRVELLDESMKALSDITDQIMPIVWSLEED